MEQDREDLANRLERCIDTKDMFEELHISICVNAPEPIPENTLRRLDVLEAQMRREIENMDKLSKKLRGDENES